MGMVMVKCPQTGHAIPTGIETDRESFGAARCFSRAPAARFAAPITPGSRGKPGSIEPASGSGARAQLPGVSVDTDQAVIAMGGHHGANANLD
jgi:hypothetical protein